MSVTPQPDPTQPRRQFVGGALLGVASSALASSVALAEDASTGSPNFKKEALHPEGAPAADSGYSPAILTQGGRLLFISGQGPEDLDADMETQVRQTFNRIGILLKAAGAV